LIHKKRGTRQVFERTLVGSGLGVVCFAFLRLPVIKGPLFGDDFLFVNEITGPNDAATPWKLLFWSGSEKWRPLSTFTMGLLARHFGYEGFSYQLINFIATVVVCGVSLLTATSQFSWYNQVSLYGTMETGSLIFLILAFRRFNKLIRMQAVPSSRELIWPAFALTCAALTHERFTIAFLAAWVITLAKWRDYPEVSRRASIFLLSPLAILFCRVFLLDLSPYQGGGETAGLGGSATSVATRFGKAILDVFGSASGGGRYYADGRFSELMNGLALTRIILLFTFPMFVLGVIAILRAFKARMLSHLEWMFLLFVMTAGLLILTASTVEERTEGRWLYCPQILLVLGLSTLLAKLEIQDRVVRTISRLVVVTSLAGLLGVALYYRGNAGVYTSLQRQANQALSTLDSLDLPKQAWSIRVIQPEVTLPSEWQFAYGKAFSQLKSPPNVVTFANEKGECSMPSGTQVCVNLQMSDIQSKSRIVLTTPRSSK
jgi:hypothetical protein